MTSTTLPLAEPFTRPSFHLLEPVATWSRSTTQFGRAGGGRLCGDAFIARPDMAACLRVDVELEEASAFVPSAELHSLSFPLSLAEERSGDPDARTDV